jgi:N-acetylmuramoyl-L-alanine amidase
VRDLSLGDRGKEVSDVQTRLQKQGVELGREGVDGFFGPRTETAVKAFQQQRGLLVDGVVGANTWRELVEAGYALGDRLLYLRVPNLRGDDVLALQVKLSLLGFNAGRERGILDEGVERAVLDFQRNAGLPVDGIVGGSTLDKLNALRKAEAGREGKKIPDRNKGYASARSLAGQVVVVDPGHGGADTGVVGVNGLVEKDFTLALGLRLAALLRTQDCRVLLTRKDDTQRTLYARAEIADAAQAQYVISLHLNGHAHPAAAGAACYFFQRGHYYSERGERLADYIGEQLSGLGGPFLGSFGRNYAILREPRAVAVLVEPFFATHAGDAARAARPDGVERLARAILAGLINYLARA